MAVVLFIGHTLTLDAKTLEVNDCGQYAWDAANAEEYYYGYAGEAAWYKSFYWYYGLCQASENILVPVFN